MSVTSALVVGGGITGSVLALALANRGVSVDLVELSPVWRGVGHGITVQGNALAALAKVGVLDEVLDRGVPFNQLRMRQADGTLIAEVPTPRTGGPGLPATLGALRSDLQGVLCERVYAAGVNVRLGLTVRGLAQDAHRAYAEFSDGSVGRYDLVVGADGIRSAVRAMLGIATTPEPTGMSIWRVVADRPAEMDCAEVYYGGPRYKAGLQPDLGRQVLRVHPRHRRRAARLRRPAGLAADVRAVGRLRRRLGQDPGGHRPRLQRLAHQDRVAAGRRPVVPRSDHRHRRRRARLPAADSAGRRHVRRGRRGAGRGGHRQPSAGGRAARVHGRAGCPASSSWSATRCASSAGRWAWSRTPTRTSRAPWTRPSASSPPRRPDPMAKATQFRAARPVGAAGHRRARTPARSRGERARRRPPGRGGGRGGRAGVLHRGQHRRQPGADPTRLAAAHRRASPAGRPGRHRRGRAGRGTDADAQVLGRAGAGGQADDRDQRGRRRALRRRPGPPARPRHPPAAAPGHRRPGA